MNASLTLINGKHSRHHVHIEYQIHFLTFNGVWNQLVAFKINVKGVTEFAREKWRSFLDEFIP